jgi:hypothetical protein
MANSAKQSPLGVNSLSALLLGQGFNINPISQDYLGSSKTNDDYTPGLIVNETCLKNLTYAINDAFRRGEPASTATMTKCSLRGTGTSAELTVGILTDGYIQPGMILTSINPGISVTLTITSNISGEGTESKWNVSCSAPATLDISDTTFTGAMPSYRVSNATYNNILAIGQSRIPALGNSKPPTYLANDPSGNWLGQATSGYAIPGPTGQGQDATWFPYDTTNPNRSVTQWGWLRTIPLQSWNAYNWQGDPARINDPTYQVEYRNYLTSVQSFNSFIDSVNPAITTMRNSNEFLDGTYSNMNDLISADITGVSLSTQAFGQDLINLGKALNIAKINNFGLPSALLEVLQANGAVSQTLTLLLLNSDIPQVDLDAILFSGVATVEQEQRIYNAFTQVTGDDLVEILRAIKCTTKGLTSLADLLNVKKLFPISFSTLTVPIFNSTPGPTNAKTYYLLFVDSEMNPQLVAPAVVAQVPPQIVVEPLPPPPPSPPVIIEQAIEEKPPAVPPQQVVDAYGGGGCVALESYIPLVEKDLKHNERPITNAWMLESGMKISLGTDELSIVDGQVVKTLNDYQPCVRISTSDGITLVCSTTAPILTKENGFIPSTEVYGKRVAVMRNGRTWYDEVVRLEDVGMKFVRVIDAGNNSFWAGETPGSYILHHNTFIREELRFAKK